MKIFLGADHGGFKLKEDVKGWLALQNYEVEDLGAQEYQPDDDYPDFAFAVAEQVKEHDDAIGILFCRSGGGMTIAANKVEGIRAVDVFDLTSAIHAKTNNNANVICFGADWMEPSETKMILQNFLDTQFNREERHVRRLKKIEEKED